MPGPSAPPLSDYHGLVAEQGLDADEALAAAGLSVYRFTGLTDPNKAFNGFGAVERESFVIELATTAEDYLEALRAASPKRFNNYRRLDHKLDREVGVLLIGARTVIRPPLRPCCAGSASNWPAPAPTAS